MPDRILDFSEEAAHLSVRLRNLVIRRGDKPEITLPLEEIAVVVAAHPQLTITQAVLSGLTGCGASLIVCDERRVPSGMMCPVVGHHLQSERIASQCAAAVPVRKRLWRQVVQTKLRAQGAALTLERGADSGLLAMAKRVRSGDPDNLEAQAARRYWTSIFGDEEFRRDRDEEGTNAVLNYGYAILRAIMARAVCGSGLHPSIGIHHHNRYNPFTLADDLMEPLRPVVDRTALQIIRTWGPQPPMDRVVKGQILESLHSRFVFHSERRSLFEIASRMSASLASVFAGEVKQLDLPDFPEFFPDAAEAA